MGIPVKTDRFEMRLDPGVLESIDAWRSQQEDVPSRAEAVRRLIEGGIVTPNGSDLKLSDGEKLIILMLCELYEHLKVKREIDPTFVASAIRGGHLWSLDWEYPGIFDGHEDNKTTVHEVIDILDMC